MSSTVARDSAYRSVALWLTSCPAAHIRHSLQRQPSLGTIGLALFAPKDLDAADVVIGCFEPQYGSERLIGLIVHLEAIGIETVFEPGAFLSPLQVRGDLAAEASVNLTGLLGPAEKAHDILAMQGVHAVAK